MTKRAVHTLVLALLFILGWVIVGWPLMGLSLFVFGSNSDIAAAATFLVYIVGFFAIYYAVLRRRNFSPWRIEDN